MRQSLALLKMRPGPFVQLVSKSLLSTVIPPVNIQTDGSYSITNNRISRTAVILTKPNGINHSIWNTYFDHANSYESEWRSVLDGLEYSLSKKEKAVKLENDNLSVMNSLIRKEPPAGLYKDYYEYIYDLLQKFDNAAFRWIPREKNKADKLFRI